MYPLSWLQAAFVGLVATAVTAIPQPLRSDTLTRRQERALNLSAYPAETIQIPVDHFDIANNKTYSNRYWVNAKYYRPGGPVFLYDPGEQRADYLVPYNLYEAAGPSAVLQLSKRFKGLAVIFEHRYYGAIDEGSYPVPINQNGMASDYRYLNTEQALEDVVYFAHNFRPAGLEGSWTRLQASNTPWVWLGGSYPGIRGAHLRVRNPETIYATWASSAPTEARVNMYTYYAQAERSMTRNCSADYTAITRWIDSVLESGNRTAVSDLKFQLYTALESDGGYTPANLSRKHSDSWSNSDVGSYLLTPFYFYQYYGFERSVLPFCDLFQTFNRSTERTTDNGALDPPIASESGIARTYNISTAWNAFLVALAELDYDSIPSNGLDDPVQIYSWGYQYCSEYGYLQVGNESNPHTIQSKFITIDYSLENCKQLFRNSSLPTRPAVEKVNRYGGFHINPSNIMFSTGEFDPWRSLSPTSTDYDVGAPGRKSVQHIPRCNVTPDTGTVFGLEYRGMVHVSDLRALLDTDDEYHQDFNTVGFASPISVEPFYAGLGLFSSALEEWLPCFRNGTYAKLVTQM